MDDEFDNETEAYYDYYHDNIEEDDCYTNSASVVDSILAKELDIEKELMYNDDEDIIVAIREVNRKD